MELNETFNKAVEASRALNLTDVSRPPIFVTWLRYRLHWGVYWMKWFAPME